MYHLAIYLLIFLLWIIFRSYPITLGCAGLLLLISITSFRYKYHFIGIALLLILIIDIFASSYYSEKLMNEIAQKECIDKKDWIQLNDDLYKKQSGKPLGIDMAIFYRESTKSAHIQFSSSQETKLNYGFCSK